MVQIPHLQTASSPQGLLDFLSFSSVFCGPWRFLLTLAFVLDFSFGSLVDLVSLGLWCSRVSFGMRKSGAIWPFNSRPSSLE